ncbi:NEL-type E3 ubiquitin ligase domain-containing protein [Pseudomonas sp. CP4]|uniref:NEL-type E3 ubiquitin ligase domain-containing protein n=1 Tax=Pseudomonas sp. CP4 TaxID=3388844 RepID=UPI0039F02BB9
MSPDSLVSKSAAPLIKPAATQSLHAPLLEASVPQWLIDAPARRRAEFKQATKATPDWYKSASPAQRDVLHKRFRDSFQAQVQLDKTMSSFKDIDAFARPLLLEALKSRYQVEVDVDKTLLCLKRPILVTVARVEVGTHEVLTLPMLQAALHNFESDECKYGAFHKSSTFAVATGTPGNYKAVPVNVSIRNFLSLCRELDIGAKYQAYLTSFFHPADPKTEAALRRQFILAQKSALHAAAEQALLTKDIRRQDHAMILSVLAGNRTPRLDNKTVSFQDLGVMRHRLVGCVVFVIYDRYPSYDEVILYVPNDPEHPLKRYTGTQMQDTLKRLLSARDPQHPQSTAPTAYQAFFSQFFPYRKRAEYFNRFIKPAHPASEWLWSAWRTIGQTVTPLGPWETPHKDPQMIPDTDPFVAAAPFPDPNAYFKGTNPDLWNCLYEKHRDKLFDDARSHAVPTEDVDAKARDAKLAALLQFGLLAANVASMFIPVLGEAMMVIMAGQLLYETVEGVVEWSDGDKHAAKAHLVDVAENLALIGVTAVAGAGLSRLRPVKPEPVIENLHPVTLPSGKTRLWKPDFSGYEQDVTFDALGEPNALAQYWFEGKTYIRQGSKVYEQVQDQTTAQWLLKHPSDPDAYRPVLVNNGHGGWRLALEQPMTWGRLDLLRRMGPLTDGFSDDALLMLADTSGISDNTLRKMHMDHLPPPAELRDAMRLFAADQGARQMIEQLRGAQAIDEQYLYALPLVPEMPRWPSGRVLEIVEGVGEAARSIQYGAQKLLSGIEHKPAIRISREQVLNGELPARIIAALEENEIVHLLGSRGAQLRPARPDEFTARLTEYAYTRQPAIFDSLYRRNGPASGRVRILQHECPGLSDEAAQDVLNHASAAELARLDATRRSPLKLLEEARWYARQGRQIRAFAGLHGENLASADSRRLALHALEQLPQWPQTLRLEIRDGSTTGALLDGIGEITAPVKRYLVKNGPFYQAFDARAQALDQVPRVEDSFYRSLLAALPDETRSALWLADVRTGRELQQSIIRSAHAHRLDAARLLEPQARWFKPPTRVSARLSGYYASGRGASWNPHLRSRAQHLYPEPRQVEAFFARRRGRTDAQIFDELESRLKDWETLNATLDRWQAGPSSSQTAAHRAQVAQALREAWRNEPLAAQTREVAQLSLVCDAPLPALTTRFDHVRELSVTGSGLTDANAEGFLAAFPQVTDLSIGEPGLGIEQTLVNGSLTTLPLAVGRMPELTRLRFATDAPLLAENFAQRLEALSSLEALRIDYSGTDSTSLHGLDFSRLRQLRTLRIDAPRALWRWPASVERLGQLQRLDLSHTLIETLPSSLYHGQERLWAGLSLDWSSVTPDTFLRAYEYVSNYAGPLGHLLDVHQMVSEFCRAELDSMLAASGLIDPLPLAFDAASATPEARLAAITALRAEHDSIFARFHAPAPHGTRYAALSPQWTTGSNAKIFNALRNSWQGAVRQRYGLPSRVTIFELSTPTGAERVVQLPVLPPGSFAHVRTLRLGGLDVSARAARRFIRAFSRTETLQISGNTFTELPFAAAELEGLAQLDAANNRIAMTPVVQRQINGLQRLRALDLSHNPLGDVDVSALNALQALGLRSTRLQVWPAGVEDLSRLSWLDLRDNRIDSVSPRALTHTDLLMRTNLAGNVFSPQGEAALNMALQRIEQQTGLAHGTLARFAAEPVPERFPPTETGASFIDELLPLAQSAAVAGETGAAAHLQRLRQIFPDERARLSLHSLRRMALSDVQIDARITEWHQTFDALTRRLNDWLYTREVTGEGVFINARSRSFAARRIRAAWLDGLSESPGTPRLELEFSERQTGDLPELDVQLPGVTSLDLTRVGITTRGSDAFLQAFPNLETLFVSGNELLALPAPVQRMRHLQRLEMQYCNLHSATSLYPLLGSGRLRALDLGYNEIRAFHPPAFGALETLDLRFNQLSEWPDGVLMAPRLHTLNLSGNRIEELPVGLFSGGHGNLLEGTDLSANERLSLSALQDLRRYSRERPGRPVLGVSRARIDDMINRQIFYDGIGLEEPVGIPEEEGGVDFDVHAAVAPVEELLDPATDIAPRSLAPWLQDTSASVAEQRTVIWTRLAQEPNHERFFQLLRLLRDTKDFNRVRADLTRRVWEVMQAAYDDTSLRDLLFHSAETHGTCVDGRILTFSDMEVRVWADRVLRQIAPDQTALRGQALVRLSRQMFRLDRVETLAEAAAAAERLDRAEVRLQYRIGLTGNWGDGVDLPGQPVFMSYFDPLSGDLLTQTRESILAAERTDALPISMVARDYWTDYLRERYPQEINDLNGSVDDQRFQLWGALDGRLERAEIDAGQYDLELDALGQAMETLRVEKLVALTRRAIDELQQVAGESQPPGRTSPESGPSSRP